MRASFIRSPSRNVCPFIVTKAFSPIRTAVSITNPSNVVSPACSSISASCSTATIFLVICFGSYTSTNGFLAQPSSSLISSEIGRKSDSGLKVFLEVLEKLLFPSSFAFLLAIFFFRFSALLALTPAVLALFFSFDFVTTGFLSLFLSI